MTEAKEKKNTDQPKKEKHDQLIQNWQENKLQVLLSSTAYTLIIIAILGGLGYIADEHLGTKPALFIAGLIMGYPITQAIIYKKMSKLKVK
ncbi:hypothetical protein CVV38_03285 [Candidatus Peregrinibacteria bacterium HGW-Peregrinibacteria-1]|jgi:F0F1-type ATP synthase assembly protein I|nr:MAG: hypothetical protein CVV38_03285 [Candidatus Peregrinibacteria bacterium HGW-Peregrinibacteria-1]